jgi:hypothetical protein
VGPIVVPIVGSEVRIESTFGVEEFDIADGIDVGVSRIVGLTVGESSTTAAGPDGGLEEGIEIDAPDGFEWVGRRGILGLSVEGDSTSKVGNDVEYNVGELV